MHLTISAQSNNERWPTWREQRLRELWRQGLTCSQVAAAMGDCTRNAVIGKVHRLGIHKDPNRPRPEPVVREPRKQVRRRVVKSQEALEAPAVPEMPVDRPPAIDGPLPPNAKPITELGPHDCKWPVTDGGPFLFCAAPRASGTTEAVLPYCMHHLLQAVDPRFVARIRR